MHIWSSDFTSKFYKYPNRHLVGYVKMEIEGSPTVRSCANTCASEGVQGCKSFDWNAKKCTLSVESNISRGGKMEDNGN